MDINKVIDTFPEPFKTVVKQGYEINFDYRLHEGKSDQEWLKRNNHEPKFCSDCSFFVYDFPGLSATSYGDWGVISDNKGKYGKEERIDGYSKSFHAFCQMYEEGIVKLWRITLWIGDFWYTYDDELKIWQVNKNDGTHKWCKCENPLIEHGKSN